MGTPGSEARNVRPAKQLTLVASGAGSRFFLTFEIKWGLYMGKVSPPRLGSRRRPGDPHISRGGEKGVGDVDDNLWGPRDPCPTPQLLFVISDGAGLTAGTKPFPDPKEGGGETGSSFREEKKALKNVGEKLLRN